MPQSYVKISRLPISSSFVPIYPKQITELLLYVQRVGLTYCKSDYVVKDRNTDSFLICYIASGKGFLDYDNKHLQLKKGDIFVIDCHHDHSYYPDKNDPFVLLFIHYHGPFSQKYTKLIINDQIVYHQKVLVDNIRNKIGNIYRAFRKQAEPNHFTLSNMIYDLLISFLNQTSQLDQKEIIIPNSINIAIDYINNNYTSKINVTHLSKLVLTSEYHFIREFKRYTHQSPYEYILYCRFNHAKELLLQSDMSISDIANKLQFNSISHFVSFFKKRESMTPLQFRKRYMIKT
ncbi:MAG: AraC family transcriptional regulator [Erysipelotrichaceae bacterium]|nr:AraC family transcriptional regulator [Erysipelotrichaceae bacterium]